MHGTSPTKRTKLSSPALSMGAASAAATALTAEPALLQTIISFIPSSGPTDSEKKASKPAVVLQTIAALCRAVPGLSRFVGPENEAFWREMVLAHFDFAVGPYGFNVEDWARVEHTIVDKMGIMFEDDLDVEDDKMMAKWRTWCEHPFKAVMDKWQRDHEGDAYPSEFLSEDMSLWQSMGAYFRGSQYEFLGDIQSDRALLDSSWPAHEDAFTLFRDLLLLQQLARPEWHETFSTYSDGDAFVTPCMLSRLDRDISKEGFEILEHCGFAPHYWCNGDPAVSIRWTGLDGPLPSVDVKDPEDSRYDYATYEEGCNFPSTYCATDAWVALRRFVYENFTDWRRIHVNEEEDPSPDFFIGKSKYSGRWLGFVGESDHCRFTWHPHCSEPSAEDGSKE